MPKTTPTPFSRPHGAVRPHTRAQIPCRDIFLDAYDSHVFGNGDEAEEGQGAGQGPAAAAVGAA